MKALQDKCYKLEYQNTELRSQIDNLQSYVDKVQQTLKHEVVNQQKVFQTELLSLREQLNAATQEKSKHLEANRSDREKFESTLQQVQERYEQQLDSV